MDFFPPGIATPPLALVALLGCPDLHGIVGEFLRAAHKPPINSLGIAEPAMAARLFGAKKAFITAPSGPLNILKADWFAKHRQQRPAVAAVFFERDAVSGDPNQWSKLLAGLEAVRQATRPRGAKTVVVIVHPPDVPNVEVPEDRLAGIIRQSGTERKWVISINTADGELALRRLGRVLYEAAGAFYLDDARRRLAVHQERRNPAPQTSSKVAFKVAALAEFRADWATAVKTYQAAYLELLRISPVGQLPLQRWTELTSVAEIMHLKVVTLLLHQANVPEALAQFAQHMGAFRRMPLPPPPAAASAHGAWLVRQYTVMGDLLSSRVEAGLLPQQREAQPAHFYLGAANAAIDRRRAAQRAAELRPPGAPAGANVAPGTYIGQVVTSDGQSPRHLSDEEFLHHLEAIEVAAAPALAGAALEKLKQAHEMVMRAGEGDARLTRLSYQLGALMAREQLVAQDPASARRLLQSVSGIYRREGWEVPLGAALLELRECASRLKLPEEHIRCSLELSCLRQCLDRPQREAMAQAAVSQLTGPIAFSAQPASPASRPSAAGPGPDKPVTDAALEFDIRPVNYGLYNTLVLSCGFASKPPEAPLPAEKGAGWSFAVALWSNLPIDLPATSVEVRVKDAQEHVSCVPAHASEAPAPEEDAASQGAIVIRPETWTRAWASGVPTGTGPLRVTDVVLRVGPDTAFVWTLANFPAGKAPIGRISPAAQQAKAPFHGLSVTSGQPELSTATTHQTPLLQVQTCKIAMAGEHAMVNLAVHASSSCPAQQAFVSASYADGGEAPLLGQPSSGNGTEDWQPGVTHVPVPALEAGAQHHTTLHMLCARPGIVSLEARLGAAPHAGQHSPSRAADAARKGETSAAVTILVELPFELRASCTAATRCCAYISGAGAAQGHVLPARMLCIVQASLGSVAPSDILLQSVSLEQSGASSAAASGVAVLHCSSAASNNQPLVFRKGDVHTVVGRIICKEPCSAVSPATLAVTWQRSRVTELATGSSSAGEQLHSSDGPSEAGHPVGPPVTTRIPLPAAYTFSSALLQVTANWPPFIKLGKPFVLQLRASNSTQHAVDLGMRLGDTTGFMVAGTRSGAKTVLPHSEDTLAYELVAISGGTLNLPDITITAPQLSAQLQPLAGCKVFAAPAPEEAADGVSNIEPRLAQLAVR